MKPQPIHFVGLDVHQSTVVACVRDESGNVVMRATVPTEQKAIVALVRNASWARVHVAFEEGTGCTTCSSTRLSAWSYAMSAASGC